MYKTKLQEMCQQKRWALPRYSSMKDGPDHDPRFKASVSVSGHSFHSSVSCRSSKHAQNNAAMLAFLHFTSPPPTPGDRLTNAEPTAGKPNIGETSKGPEKHTKAPDVQCQYKSQLQNYVQRKNIDSPSYTSIREGPAHAPCFKAKVTVDGHTFESPDLYKSRKAAEHAAANVALMSLSFDGFQESPLQQLNQRKDLSKSVYKTFQSSAPHLPTLFSTCSIERVEADGHVKPTLSSELIMDVHSQNLEQNCTQLVSSPDIKQVEASKAEIVSANANTSSEDYFLSPVKPFMDDMTGNLDRVTSCSHMAASVQGGSFSSPMMTHVDVSAPLIPDSSVGKTTGTTSYLLCNRVRVYPCFPDISFPKGITVLPISENRWVAVSLELPDEEGN